ncbi:MAG: GspH/FimT family pseudopilin [Burkholderiales bacterium]|nr:GspH/FimT family pseudopilin [Burkholderiales bacterium]MBK8665861.1 GspH/FimT family pseudopilin [Burkholderiales bacterium]
MKRKHQRGLTAIELMVVVVIAAILATIAVPSFNDLINRRRVEGLANELSADIQYAHSESISHNMDVSLTTTTGNYKVTRNGTDIKTVPSLPTATSLTAGTITFTAFRGLSAAGAAFTVSNSAVANQLMVIVNTMGRTQICAPSNAWGGYAVCPAT